MKRQATDRDKILPINPDKGLKSKICKEPLQLNNKKTIQFQMWSDLNWDLSKKDVQMDK